MEIDYNIIRSPRRRKLTITVERDRSVVVHAPEETPEETPPTEEATEPAEIPVPEETPEPVESPAEEPPAAEETPAETPAEADAAPGPQSTIRNGQTSYSRG